MTYIPILVYTDAMENYEKFASKERHKKSIFEQRLGAFTYQPIYILQNT